MANHTTFNLPKHNLATACPRRYATAPRQQSSLPLLHVRTLSPTTKGMSTCWGRIYRAIVLNGWLLVTGCLCCGWLLVSRWFTLVDRCFCQLGHWKSHFQADPMFWYVFGILVNFGLTIWTDIEKLRSRSKGFGTHLKSEIRSEFSHDSKCGLRCVPTRIVLWPKQQVPY